MENKEVLINTIFCCTLHTQDSFCVWFLHAEDGSMHPKIGRNCVFVVKSAKQSWDMDRGFQGYLLLKITADCTSLNFNSYEVQGAFLSAYIYTYIYIYMYGRSWGKTSPVKIILVNICLPLCQPKTQRNQSYARKSTNGVFFQRKRMFKVFFSF